MSNGNYPTSKDKVELYLDFYRDFIALFNTRRNFEWKVNLSLWAAIALLAGGGLRKDVADLKINGYVFVGIHVALWLLYTFLWTAGVQGANRLDRRRGFAYKDAVEDFLAGRNPGLPVPKRPQEGRSSLRPSFAYGLGALFFWSPVFQILITLGLLAINVLIYWDMLQF